MSARGRAIAQEIGAGAAGFALALAFGGAAMAFLARAAGRPSAPPWLASRAAFAPPRAVKLAAALGAPIGGVSAARGAAGAPARALGLDGAPDFTPRLTAGSDPAAADPLRLVIKEHLGVAHQQSVSAPAAAFPPDAQEERAAAPSAAKLEPFRGAGVAAATVHYGVSGRAELMSRAAGPVYNFSRLRGLSVSSALARIGAARRVLYGSGDLRAADQRALDEGLSRIRAGAEPSAGQ
ncbi:MAG: hypothetical protein HY552_03335 [Elusimicrobia bacterium]|nr:hypothetical protein [Elusimicrobiota bacterium]